MRRFFWVLGLPVLLACGSGANNGDIAGGGGDDSDGDGGAVVIMDDGGIAFPPTSNQYVNARRCPACHEGPDPQTTGTMSGATAPIPGNFGTGVTLYGPNLTPDPTTGIGSWTDDQLTNAILNGIDNQGERLCPQMSHFPSMGTTELQSIIAFLRALPAVSNQTPSSVCPPLKYGPPN
ncbi:MAG: hypothetical protein ABSE49_05765 [Polyangiaceae bacterium]|jgi:hypothetical protein